MFSGYEDMKILCVREINLLEQTSACSVQAVSLTQKFTRQSWGFLGVSCLVKFETVPYAACAMQTSVGGSAEPLGHF